MVQDREKCQLAGMNDFVSKPFELSELCEVLARWRLMPAKSVQPAVESMSDESTSASLPGIDVAQGLHHCFKRRDLFDRLLRMFLESQSGAADALRQALAVGERKVAERMVHTLKSNAGTLGAIELSAAAARVEDILREIGETGAIETCDSAVAVLVEKLIEVIEGLNAYFAQGAN